jgi:type I thyroxine 5'-deiodinase
VPNNVQEGVEFAQARTEEERSQIATTCAVSLNLNIPILIDNMDDAAERAYSAWPERLYVLSKQGIVIYKGGKGPYGFNPEELERFLDTLRSG